MSVKPQHSLSQSTAEAIETVTEIWVQYRGKKLPTCLLLAFCFNLLIAPVVLAASNSEFSRSQAWAIGLLGFGTVALAVYLFFVMFVPEKF